MQALPFFVTIAGLHYILFKPMLAYLADRREATEGERKKAHALTERAELKLQQWEAALLRAHVEVAEFRSGKRAEAQAVYAKRVATARAQAEKRIADEVAVIAGEAELAREQVSTSARQIAQDMAVRTLGRSASPVDA